MLKPPSPELASKLVELWADLIGKRHFWQKRKAPNLIEQIGILGQPVALLDFINLVHHDESDVRDAAEDMVRVLLPKMTPDEVMQLELRVRESWSRYWTNDHVFRAEWPTSWELSTFDPNGHKRERALILLESLSDFGALPFILLRLNDWVRQIRERAESWITKRIKNIPTTELIRNFSILSATHEREKGSASLVLVSLLERFNHAEAARQLLESLPMMSNRTRRSAFRILSESGFLLNADSQDFLLQTQHPFLGVLLITTLRTRGLHPPERWLASAVESSSTMLRRLALNSWEDAGYPGLLDAVRRALLDPAAGIRDFAQYWTRKLDPSFELTAFYQGELGSTQSPIRLSSAIAGLHETGGRLEAESYSAWLSSNHTIVRVAALRAFALVHPDDCEKTLERFLIGENGAAMEKAAFKILLKKPSSISIAALRKASESTHRRSTRIRALAIVMKKDKWVPIPILLRLLRDPDETLSLHVRQVLTKWLWRFNRTWTQPTAQLLRETEQELIKSKPLLGESMIATLESIFKDTKSMN